MPHTKHDELIWACDRALAGITEVKTNAVKLAQLEQQITAAQQTLAGLNGQIEQAKKLALQLPEVEQQIRTKHSELADLDAIIKRKNKDHGDVEAGLRDLRKRISGDPTHA